MADKYGFPDPAPKPPKDPWDCIHPAAYLCYCISVGTLAMDDKIKETLYNFGWLSEDGERPDYERMNREFERNK